MALRKVLPALVLLLFTLALASAADIDMGFPCFDDTFCLEVCDSLGVEGCYCDLEIESCFEPDPLADPNPFPNPLGEDTSAVSASTEASTSPPPTFMAQNELISTLESKVQLLQTSLQALEADLTALETDVGGQLGSVSALQQQISSVNSNLNTNQQQLNQFSTGLAVLQKNFNDTQTNLTAVSKELAREKAISTLLLSILFLIIAIVVFFVLKEYMAGRGDPKILEYITEHIKQGKKYPYIKENLLKAGWKEPQIENAYKQTMKKNYKQYLQKAGVQSVGYDKRKMYAIVGITVALIIVMLLIVNGTVGKAIFTERLVDGSRDATSGEISYTVECTPPHILTPDQDACCLDVNANGLCDNQERAVEEVAVGCTDNNQCGVGEFCIDRSCSTLSSMFSGSGDCSKPCNFYAVKISTSDEETYNLKAREGSYTATGALEWKVMAAPTHCKGEPAVVPVRLIRKEHGSILNEEVISLTQGQTKEVRINPDHGNMFSLTLDRVYEFCPE